MFATEQDLNAWLADFGAARRNTTAAYDTAIAAVDDAFAADAAAEICEAMRQSNPHLLDADRVLCDHAAARAEVLRALRIADERIADFRESMSMCATGGAEIRMWSRMEWAADRIWLFLTSTWPPQALTMFERAAPTPWRLGAGIHAARTIEDAVAAVEAACGATEAAVARRRLTDGQAAVAFSAVRRLLAYASLRRQASVLEGQRLAEATRLTESLEITDAALRRQWRMAKAIAHLDEFAEALRNLNAFGDDCPF